MERAASNNTVMVIGATGALGTKICKALLDRGAHVRALVRASSDRSKLQALGISDFAVGDMMDPASLKAALANPIDAIVASAAGYTRHTKGDSPEADRAGYRNLVDAAKAANVPRFVLISILECDHAANVPHFHDKHAIELYLAEKGQPYVALRAGAFLDQSQDFLTPGLAKGEYRAFVQHVRYGQVYTPDLAGYAATAAVDLPERWLNASIDVGWDKTYTSEEIAQAFSRVLGRPIHDTAGLPPVIRKVVFPVAAIFAEPARDMLAMVRWIEAGNYVSRNPQRQREAFGEPPAIDDVLRRFCLERGLLPGG
jgi:uncharacterized protein YbjT (DUF2867 family)